MKVPVDVTFSVEVDATEEERRMMKKNKMYLEGLIYDTIVNSVSKKLDIKNEINFKKIRLTIS